MVVPEADKYKALWLRAIREGLPVPVSRVPHPREKPYPTQDEMVALLASKGIAIERTEYNKRETGRTELSDELAAEIARAFDVPGPVRPQAAASDLDRLVRAMTEQTAAINRVMDYLLGVEPVPSEKAEPSPDPAAQLPRLARLSAMSALGTLRLAAEEAQRAEDEPDA